jgi:hypothetical protein
VLALGALALAALAISLLLAFASVTAPLPKAPTAAPAAQPLAVSTAAGGGVMHENEVGRGAAGNGPSRPPLLWALLTPWALAVDALAVLGLAAVLIVRYTARRRSGARK